MRLDPLERLDSLYRVSMDLEVFGPNSRRGSEWDHVFDFQNSCEISLNSDRVM
jgi:hypothetical protein